MAEQGVASQRYNTELSLSDLTTFKSKELWLTLGCLVEGGGSSMSFWFPFFRLQTFLSGLKCPYCCWPPRASTKDTNGRNSSQTVYKRLECIYYLTSASRFDITYDLPSGRFTLDSQPPCTEEADTSLYAHCSYYVPCMDDTTMKPIP